MVKEQSLHRYLAKHGAQIVGLKSILFLSVAFVACHASCRLLAAPLEIAYAYSLGNRGGLAIASIDESTGRILKQESKYESPHCRTPKKVRPVGKSGTYVVTQDSDKMPYVFVIDVNDSRTSRLIELPAPPDEARIAGNQAILTCGQDKLATIDILSRSLLGVFDVTDILIPKGNGPEGIRLTSDNRYAIVSFQKDSSGGKKKGGRIAVFELPGMDLKSDILLARDYSDWKIKNFIRRQGPGPELIFLDESNDKLLATSDHYGALALMSWSDVLAGRLSKLTYLSAARDKSWGNSFPDRGVQFDRDGRPYCLILNAGREGGAVILDMLAEKIVCHLDTPPGLDVPIYIPKLSRVFAGCPGKMKRRIGKVVVKKYLPKNNFYVFELADDLSQSSVIQVESEQPLYQLGALPRSSGVPLIVASTGTEKAITRIAVFDPVKMEFTDEKMAIGVVAQFARD